MARTKFQICMSRKLKGNLAGKSKSKRESIFKSAAKACSRETGGSSKSKPRAKARTQRSTRRSTTVTTRRTSPLSKPKPRSRSKGKLERTRLKFKREFDDIARALGIPLSKTSFKIVGNQWVLRAGKVKAKRVKLADAMRLFRKNARKRL